MTIGMLLNMDKNIDGSMVEKMSAFFQKRGSTVRVSPYQKKNGLQSGIVNADFFAESDMIIAFGGDGTLLGAARDAAMFQKPVLGFNLGKLGFLTEALPGDFEQVADCLLKGEFSLDHRLMLRAVLPDGSFCDALNDVVVSRRAELSILRTEIFIGDEQFDRLSADGVVVASPTGSTAYSLSCGGPVIGPGLNCMVISPICPHSLRARPVVVSPKEVIRIQIGNQAQSARVDADGVFCAALEAGQSVRITQSPLTAQFIRIHSKNFYQLLREKLAQWSL